MTEMLNEHIVLCQTVNKLIHQLLTPVGDVDVILIMAENQKDLKDIITMGDLFEGRSTILILPDTQKETFALGCKLFPRFIGFLDSDFSDVKIILHNIIARNRN